MRSQPASFSCPLSRNCYKLFNRRRSSSSGTSTWNCSELLMNRPPHRPPRSRLRVTAFRITKSMKWPRETMTIAPHVGEGCQHENYSPDPENPGKRLDGFEYATNFVITAPSEVFEIVLEEKKSQNEQQCHFRKENILLTVKMAAPMRDMIERTPSEYNSKRYVPRSPRPIFARRA